MTPPASTPPKSPRGAAWVPWLIVAAIGALGVLRWLGVLGPC
jgi:hypothetical protein